MSKKIAVAITGASGSIYAQSLIKKIIALNKKPSKIALIFSESGRKVWDFEIGDFNIKSDIITEYQNNDFFAPVASGSSGYDGMIIIPCSMGTLGRIASGTSEDLICRAADVMLKERKKLILVIREAPLNLIHIENMKTITLAGGIIYPASPSFYSKPENLEELIDTVINRVLDLLGLDNVGFRWGEN
jgi:4-hydroxy-3-polyprenylbenzoate decarboxylase